MCRILDARLVSLTRLRFTGKTVDQKQMDQREQKFKVVAQAAAAAAKKREKKKGVVYDAAAVAQVRNARLSHSH